MAVDALFGVHFQGNGSCHYTNIDLIPVNNLQSETCYLHLETIHTEYRGLSFITWCNDNHWRSTSTKSMSLCWTTAVYLLVCTFTKTKPNSLFLVFTTQSLKLILHIVKHGGFRHMFIRVQFPGGQCHQFSIWSNVKYSHNLPSVPELWGCMRPRKMLTFWCKM